MRRYARIYHGNRERFRRLFASGTSIPDFYFRLTKDCTTRRCLLGVSVAKLFPKAEWFTLVGGSCPDTVVFRIRHFWVMRNGNNCGAYNFVAYDSLHEEFLWRQNVPQLLELIQILLAERSELPLFIGIDKPNSLILERRLKGDL